MLKSLHHVPEETMPKVMSEIVRVLKPGRIAYFPEPLYSGKFNALMSLIHDEKKVRESAFKAIQGLLERRSMTLLGQFFLNVPGCYESWEAFESRFLNVTHTRLQIDKVRYISDQTGLYGPYGCARGQVSQTSSSGSVA